MSLRRVGIRVLGDSFPRVSGDEPPGDGGSLARALFSPRERG